MLKEAPPGSVGVAHSSGWMTAENFNKWIAHFIHHSNCSKERPVLLLMDNHQSHITIDSLNLAKENGIHLLTFPPHCSHKLQPLDRSVYGPLKRYYNSACDGWQKNHAGKAMTLYDVAENLGIAYPRAFTAQNIISGFKVAGVFPFDREVFGEHEFLPSYVTDRPAPQPDDEDEQTVKDVNEAMQ